MWPALSGLDRTGMTAAGNTQIPEGLETDALHIAANLGTKILGNNSEAVHCVTMLPIQLMLDPSALSVDYSNSQIRFISV